MEEKNIQCPECKSLNIKEELYKAAAGPGRSNGKLPPEEEHIKYFCLDCGHEFYEDELEESNLK